jgi:hypothetical protein
MMEVKAAPEGVLGRGKYICAFSWWLIEGDDEKPYMRLRMWWHYLI